MALNITANFLFPVYMDIKKVKVEYIHPEAEESTCLTRPATN